MKNIIYISIEFFIMIIYIILAIFFSLYYQNYEITNFFLCFGIVLALVMFAFSTIRVYFEKNDKLSNIKKLKKLVKLFDSFSEGIIVFDSSISSYFVSDMLVDLLGISKKDILKNNIYDINGVNISNIIFECVKNKNTIDEEKFYTLINEKTAKEIYVSLILKKVNFVDNTWYIVVVSDKTSEVNKKKDLVLRLNYAENLAREKTRFLSRVSHEIRTPLNGIIGMAEIAKENLSNKDTKGLENSIEKISFSSHYLLSIVENVLNLSKFEAGKSSLELKSFSVSKMLDEIKIVVSSQITQKNLSFKLTKNFEDVYIKTDQTKLIQILINILSNSIKYTNKDGEIYFDITSENITKGKVKLKFTIKDTGIGMTKKFLKTLYEPFSQEHQNSNVAGTGLGLAITKSLVTLLKGKISVTSEKNVGTATLITFIFDEISNEETESKEEKIYNTVNYSKYRVLVVEDNDINVTVIKNHLDHFHFKVDVAPDGQIGLNMFRASPTFYYDIILMDIHMPNMDGYEATDKIRNSTRKDNNVIIIALTADTLQDDISNFFIHQMNNHIAKPVIRDKMIQTIYETLNENGKI